MAHLSKYQQFLSHPTNDALAPGAALHYLPSSTSVSDAPAILKHLRAQSEQLKAKHNVLSAIEAPDSLCVETETTLRFETGGGAYLPGLDDNFIADKVVSVPVVHIVSFNKDGKLLQIRLYWDQAALLKSVNILGARGNSWPVSDGAKQLRTLTGSNDAVLAAGISGASIGDPERHGRAAIRGGANADKHTSLSLFAPRNYDREESPANPVNPRSSAKPPPRDYYDLFSGGADAEQLPSDPTSPSKDPPNPTKAGAGKNFQGNRLFDASAAEDAAVTSPGSPEKSVKTNPQKYKHFEFGETILQTDPQKMAKHNKHASQWNFEDFVTPEKPRQKTLAHQERHFGWSDDEDEASKPPVHRPFVPKARPDAKTHFDFTDEATPKGSGRPVSSRAQNDKMSLYEDNVLLADEKPIRAVEKQVNAPLARATNVNLQGHRKNFGSQFEMSDVSPSSLNPVGNENAKVAEGRKQATRSMQASWDMYDESPNAKPRGINIQGDGMGGRKNPGEKSWWEY